MLTKRALAITGVSNLLARPFSTFPSPKKIDNKTTKLEKKTSAISTNHAIKESPERTLEEMFAHTQIPSQFETLTEAQDGARNLFGAQS